MEHFQVIVIGAGPVGCVAAYRLAQAGIDVLVLEADASCAEDLRASTIHPPTIDMLAELGVLDELDAQGLRAPVYQYRNRPTGEVLSFDLGELADQLAHPYRLQCEQFKLSRLLSQRVEAHPHGRVIFSRRAVHFDQDEHGVTVHVEAPFKIEAYRADFLIAADGANSIVRKWLDITFSGFTYPEKFLTISTDYPLEDHFENLARVNYVADPEEWCVLLRVPELWRVLVPTSDADDDPKLLSDAKKNEVFDRLIGDGARIRTQHRTLYRVHQRVADTYRLGRVVLAGDAAHLNNPLGGFGMNSGLHDAWNLTAKLIDILKNGAPFDPLLDHYVRQRRTVMQDFVQAQTIQNKAMLESGSAQSQAALQRRMEAIHANDDQRREYLLVQSMVRSLEREAAIA